MFRRCRPQRGFAAVLAIVLVVMLGGLALALVTVSGGQQAGSTLDVRGAKAYQAAHAGIATAIQQVLNGTPCTGVGGVDATTFNFGAVADLSDFQVTLNCVSTDHEEVATVVTMHSLSATACPIPAPAAACSGATTPTSPAYVERQLRVTVGSN
jgi:MSHA biogenesis protein MshP